MLRHIFYAIQVQNRGCIFTKDKMHLLWLKYSNVPQKYYNIYVNKMQGGSEEQEIEAICFSEINPHAARRISHCEAIFHARRVFHKS